MSNLLTRKATFLRSWGPQLGSPDLVEMCANHGEGMEMIGSGRGSVAYLGDDGLVYKSWHLDEWDDYRPIPDGAAVIEFAQGRPEEYGPFLAHTSEWEYNGTYVYVQEYIEPLGSVWDLEDDEQERYTNAYANVPEALCDDFHGGNVGYNPRDPQNFLMFDV